MSEQVYLTARKVGKFFLNLVCVCVCAFEGVCEELYIVYTRMASDFFCTQQHKHLQSLLIVACTRLSCE